MYLKAIEIQGFKSFPDKTVMTFGSDITAIVGPNGSGKSNISDAIRWVMGEMSTKALRGSKMEDVIFGGTLKRPQVGFAEVSLVLDNSEQIFKMESSEIMVTRRYYRSGDSEYYINRQSARLRDINELFMDTGLGKEGYCNIGQGRIDEILSAKSTDRREIFEEAAGISKYRHRKEETERKLQQTQDNLLRINDKISELELQVEPLREQAEKAKKYLIFRDELRGLEVTVWLSQLEKLSETAKKAENDYNSAKFILEQGKSGLEGLYARVENLAESLRQMDVEAEKLRAEMSEVNAEVANRRSDVAVLNTRMRGNEANIARMEKEMSAQQSRSGDLEAQIKTRDRRMTEIREEKITQLAIQKEQESALRLAQEKALKELGELNERQQEKNRLLAQEAELRSTIAANLQSVQNITDRKLQVEQTRKDSLAKQQETAEAASQNRNALKQAEEKAASLKNTITGYQLRAQGRVNKHKSQQESCNQLKIQLDTISSRIRMYREMERDYEGYSKATRIVMQEAAKGNLKGIHGPVSKLLRTKDEYTVAIETALGASMGSVVVGTEQEGKAAIGLLRRRDGGRATFLPMNAIRGRRLQEKGLEDSYGFVGLGCDLISYDGKYRDIMESLLGRTAVAEDMDCAITIANRFGHRFRIVTLDGQVLNAGGSMTGGSTAKSSGVLTRANELARMEQQQEKLQQQQIQAQQLLQNLAKAAAEAEAEIADAQNALRNEEDQVLKLRQQENHYTVLNDTLAEAIASADRELAIVDNLLTGGQNQNDMLNQQSMECRQKAESLEVTISQVQQRVDAANRAVSRLQEDIHQTSLKQTALDAELDSNRSSRQELQELADALSGDREQQLSLLNEYKRENVSIAGEIEQKQREIDELEVKSGEKQKLVLENSEKRTSLEAKKTQTEREAQQKSKDLMNMEGECARLDQKRTTTAMEEKQILDKLWDTYELTATTAEEAKVEIESVSAAQKRVAELKRKMNGLGSPNLGAIDEFQRVNERYTYLTEQRDDVEKSQKELQKIVSDITGEMTEIFSQEFQKINEYFGQTFTEMFGGGKASLHLEDENDVLSCGIEIKVQPPGKQVKTIMLLSGGEKAFVAIALYFAIMKVRPTPFCMLDEIDAALDDRNVARFAAYLRNLSSKTQFIVITHRRGTMEASDVLYGVTMQEQGVSKVLSVDINQVAKELNIT